MTVNLRARHILATVPLLLLGVAPLTAGCASPSSAVPAPRATVTITKEPTPAPTVTKIKPGPTVTEPAPTVTVTETETVDAWAAPQGPGNGYGAEGCDPNYAGGCVPIVSYDLDCADIGQSVTVVGYDVHGFDGDGDGYGCESY